MLRGFRAVSLLAEQELGVRNLYGLLVEVARDEPTSGRTFNVALDSLGIPYDSALLRRMAAVYHAGPPPLALSLYLDVLPTLENLRSSYKLALITDGKPEVQRSKINCLSIGGLFDRVYLTGELGPYGAKPSTKAFVKAMKELEADGPSCAFVGNDPSKDFLAPNQLGWLTIQINRGKT